MQDVSERIRTRFSCRWKIWNIHIGQSQMEWKLSEIFPRISTKNLGAKMPGFFSIRLKPSSIRTVEAENCSLSRNALTMIDNARRDKTFRSTSTESRVRKWQKQRFIYCSFVYIPMYALFKSTTAKCDTILRGSSAALASTSVSQDIPFLCVCLIYI